MGYYEKNAERIYEEDALENALESILNDKELFKKFKRDLEERVNEWFYSDYEFHSDEEPDTLANLGMSESDFI